MKVTITVDSIDATSEHAEFRCVIERPERDEARGGFWIGSRAKVCPSCLSIWALMQTERDPVYGVDSQFCEVCRVEYCNGVPGSLLDDRQSWTVDWDLIRYLPEPLLRREFELHVRMIERETRNECTVTDAEYRDSNCASSPYRIVTAAGSERTA